MILHKTYYWWYNSLDKHDNGYKKLCNTLSYFLKTFITTFTIIPACNVIIMLKSNLKVPSISFLVKCIKCMILYIIHFCLLD